MLKWDPLLIIVMPFLLTDSPQKLKLEMTDGTLRILIDVSPISPQQQKRCFLLIKSIKTNYSSASEFWEYINYCFKENYRKFLKFSSLKRILEFQDWKKRPWNFYKKENFKPKFNPKTQNLHNEISQSKKHK